PTAGSKPGSSARCSTGAAGCITAGSPRLPREPGKGDWRSDATVRRVDGREGYVRGAGHSDQPRGQGGQGRPRLLFRRAPRGRRGGGAGRGGGGYGKAKEVPAAIAKGVEEAKRKMFEVPMMGTTIPHQVTGEDGAGIVLLKPAAPGTGVIPGGPVRALVECAGIKD